MAPGATLLASFPKGQPILTHPKRCLGCLSEAQASGAKNLPILSAFQILLLKEILFLSEFSTVLGASCQEAQKVPDWMAIYSQILLLIPRILDIGAYCLKVLFIFSCWPTLWAL